MDRDDKRVPETPPPLSMEQIALKRPILATSDQAPKTLIKPSIYVETASPSSPPRLHIEPLAQTAESAFWKVTLDGLSRADIAAVPCSRKTRLKRGEVLSSRTLSKTEAPCFRPRDAEMYYQPRCVRPELPRHLRRFKGDRVLPMVFTQIFWNDDREYSFDPSYPWSCIGKIRWRNRTGQQVTATAALVGPRTILTAAHALPWTQDAAVWFVPHSVFGIPFIIDAPSAFVLEQSAYEWVEGNDIVAGYDMAVCHISEPLGDTLGYFGARKYVDDWEDKNYWTTVGYPWDMAQGQVPVVERGIAVVDDDSDSHGTLELETKADTASGMSGGPLFGFWDDGPYIIGVSSGRQIEFEVNFSSFEDINTVFAGGNGLPALVNWARSQWGGIP